MSDSKTVNDLWYMKLAYEKALLAYDQQEVPVGAILVDSSHKIISSSCNQKENKVDPTSHAEIEVIRDASKILNTWRLTDLTMYVTLEPCLMCLGAISHARIKRLVFGSYDSKGGALSLGYDLHQDKRLNHRFSVTGGVYHYECSKLISTFFKERRKGYTP